MAQKVPSKTPAPRKTRSSTPDDVMTMLKFTGNPSAALKNLTLPAGAEVVIVSKSGEDIKKLQRRRRHSFGDIREFKVKLVSRAGTPQPPIVNHAAFEPDARSLAKVRRRQ
jgi:hypothetical protein